MGRLEKRRPVRLRAYQAGLGLLEQLPDGSVGSCCGALSVPARMAQDGFAASLQNRMGWEPCRRIRLASQGRALVPWCRCHQEGFSSVGPDSARRGGSLRPEPSHPARLTFLGRTPTGLPLLFACTRPSRGTLPCPRTYPRPTFHLCQVESENPALLLQ